MALYAHLTDCLDAALIVTEAHLDDADVYVDLSLRERGFTSVDIALIVLPNAALKAIAVAWAKRSAAIEGALGEDSPLIDKAKQYEKTAENLASKLTREALGLPPPTDSGAGFGFFGIGRA